MSRPLNYGRITGSEEVWLDLREGLVLSKLFQAHLWNLLFKIPKVEFLSSPGNIAKHVAGFALKIIALRSVSISFIPVWHACITFFGGQNMLQVSFLIRAAFVHTVHRAGKAWRPFSWRWDGTRKAVVCSSTQFPCVPQFSCFCLAKF